MTRTTGRRLEVMRIFDSPALQPGDLAWDGATLWHVDRQRNLIYNIDADTGEVLQEFEFVGRAAGIAASKDFLWVTDASVPMIYCFDRHSHAVVGHLPVPAETAGEGALAFDGVSLWQVDNPRAQLLRLDAVSGALLEVVEVDANLTGLSEVAGDLVFCDFGDGSLRRLNVENKLTRATYQLPGTPLGLAWESANRFWYVDADFGQLCQLRLV